MDGRSGPPAAPVVDPSVLANDVVQNVVFLATLPLLWLLLYLVAWEWPELARATGFGRLTFWLLLPGALLGWVGNLPFFGFAGAVLAINIGGGVVPLILAALLLKRVLPDDGPALPYFTSVFAGESVAALAWVLLVPEASGWTLLAGALAVRLPFQLLGVGAIAAAGTLVVLVGAGRDERMRPLSVAVGLSSLALFVTFLTTQTSAGVGIVSAFPYYLLTPALTGALAVLLAHRATGRGAHVGVGLGYAAATFGVLVGADVLRQPPLYAAPTNALYSIGGAGVLDLLYLTGLLSLAVSLAVYGLLRRSGRAGTLPAVPESDQPLTPAGRLRASLLLLLGGQFPRATEEAARASHEARAVVRGLYGLPATSFTGQPWSETGAPPWAEADQANLDALARASDVGPRDAWRAHLTARYLVRLARQIGRRRYGSTYRRSAAFVLDLLLLLVPAVGVWWYLSATLPGTVTAILGSALFNAAALGFATYAFAYFVLAEVGWGATLGKTIFRLRVKDRALRPVRPVPVLVRDLPKLLPLSILGIGGAVVTLLAVKGGALVSAGAGGISLPAQLLALSVLALFVAVGIGLCGLASLIAIYSSGENQRLGDYLAGTWVIQE